MNIHQYGVNRLTDEQNGELFRLVLNFVETAGGYVGGGYSPVNKDDETRQPKLEDTKHHFILSPKKGKGRIVVPKYMTQAQPVTFTMMNKGESDGI